MVYHTSFTAKINHSSYFYFLMLREDPQTGNTKKHKEVEVFPGLESC